MERMSVLPPSSSSYFFRAQDPRGNVTALAESHAGREVEDRRDWPW